MLWIKTRRRVGALVISLALLGCQPTPSAPVGPSPSASAALVAELGQITRDDPQHAIHMQWPVVRGLDPLNSKLSDYMHSREKSFEAETSETAGAIPVELNGTWQMLHELPVVAVRLTVQENLGQNPGTRAAVFYGRADKAWSSSDLIEASKRESLAQAVLDQLSQRYEISSTPAAFLSTAGVLDDITFPTPETLRIALPQASVVESSAGIVEVQLPAAAYLSEEGKQIAKEANLGDGAQHTPTPAASTSPSPTPTPTTPAAAAPAVDCAAVKCVALTFDDGPGPYTNQILTTLEKYQIRATFFELAPAIKAYPDVVKRQAASGMVIGSHTISHRQLTQLSRADQQAEVDGPGAALAQQGITTPPLLRPPYGSWNDDTRALGYPIILWDVDSEDWKNRDATATTSLVLKEVHPGAIVLMHDIHPSTAQALPGLIDQLKAQGYVFVTVPELLGQPHPGTVYYGRGKTR